MEKSNKVNLFFISDTHFNHENIIKYSNRPFDDLEHMTEHMIGIWNCRVGKGDIVYHLGDFALSWGAKHKKVIDNILGRLNGNKHLIVGNHDRDEVVKNKRWNTVSHYKEIKVDLGGIHKQRIVMCHYAMRVFNQSHRGAWMLYGHSHGNLDPLGKSMDVGVDANNYEPISLEEIKEIMDSREIHFADHHKG